MTPAQIDEAIALGRKASGGLPLYLIRQPGFIGSQYKPVLGSYSTPFLRIVQASYSAAKRYEPFSAQDVTPAMIAPEIHVYAFAQVVGARVANVETVVITPRGRRDPEAAIRPTTISDISVEFRNLFGLKADGKSVLAIFPLTVLNENNDIHIVYDSGVHAGAVNKFCEDCVVPFKLDKDIR